MRELKFRVWNKTMHHYRHFVLQKGVSVNIRADLEIEQYTGLKDKNGKEIYEGDIIQEEIDFNSKMTDGTFRYRVYWDEEELCWCLEHIGNESIHHELWQFDESTEVIGNIHENQELLEQDDAKD